MKELLTAENLRNILGRSNIDIQECQKILNLFPNLEIDLNILEENMDINWWNNPFEDIVVEILDNIFTYPWSFYNYDFNNKIIELIDENDEATIEDLNTTIQNLYKYKWTISNLEQLKEEINEKNI